MTDERMRRKRFAFLGAGIIAGVFIERLLSARVTAPENILATDVDWAKLDHLNKRFGIKTSLNNCYENTICQFSSGVVNPGFMTADVTH